MKCVNPRRIPNPKAKGVEDAYLLVSCGKCYACLANRRRSWLFRLQNESLNSKMTLFCTFTYDEDNCDGWLHKEHLQEFFKRLRNYESFRYYAIGEYGTNTHRPHYHCVLFLKSVNAGSILDDFVLLIDGLWKKGFTAVSRASYRRLNYVLHYHTRPKEINGRSTFQLFSKGLGIDFIDKSYLRYLKSTNSSIVHDYNGNAYVVPRYYRKKLKEMLINTPDGLFQLPDKEFSIINDARNDDEDFYKIYGRHLYEVSSSIVASYLHDCVAKDTNKLIKYNNQDKFR